LQRPIHAAPMFRETPKEVQHKLKLLSVAWKSIKLLRFKSVASSNCYILDTCL